MSAAAPRAPRHQLTRVERLGHVVVRAELQPHDLVGILDARRQHDDRRVAFAAQGAGDLQTVDAGQAQVEHHQVRLFAPRLDQRGLPVVGLHDREAGLLQIGTHQPDDLGLIVHHQNFRAHRTSAFDVRGFEDYHGDTEGTKISTCVQILRPTERFAWFPSSYLVSPFTNHYGAGYRLTQTRLS